MRNLKITLVLVFIAFGGVAARPARAASGPLEDLLRRAREQVSSYLDRISEVSCSERVLQEKLGDNGKTVEKEESAFNYLILLSSASGEISLVESRLADEDKPAKKLQRPLCFSSFIRTTRPDSSLRTRERKPSVGRRLQRFISNMFRALGRRQPWQSVDGSSRWTFPGQHGSTSRQETSGESLRGLKPVWRM